MLKFIVGKPASGKTYQAVEVIKELCKNNKKSILLVPEQFTFENERLLLKKLGDNAALYTSVLSFSRLCDDVGRVSGGIAGRLLSDADKIIFMSRALKSCANNLKLWGKYTSSISFAKTMLDTVGEFRINAITPQDLLTVAESSKPTLAAKLRDIATIYEEYNILLGEKFIDPADRLTKLYYLLENSDFFKGKTVILDSFKGFTGQQYLILERIISKAEDVYVCFTDNIQNNSKYGLFANIRIATEKIKNIAKKYSVEISESLILEESRYNSQDLKKLENFLSTSVKENVTEDDIKIIGCSNKFAEGDYCARTIRKMVREKGYRYRDFVIIARDADTYTDAVTTACEQNGVSVFYDKRVPISSFPVATAINFAIKALNFNTEDILNFNKTGLGTLNNNEIYILQNYAYLWNVNGELWNKEWDMNPAGFKTDNYRAAVNVSLETINKLRIKAIAPLLKFQKAFNYSAENRVRAIVVLMNDCDFSKKLTLLAQNKILEYSQFSADVLKQSYDAYINILDSLAVCYGDRNISDSEFSDSLNLAVSLSSVGVIPQMLDQVIFGSADRIRPSRPKVAFILGANQGVFPKSISNNGVFNVAERKALLESKLPIADNSVYTAIDEEFLVYSNLCCPSDKLYISYSNATITGETLEPSSFIQNIKESLSVPFDTEPKKLIDVENMPETENSLFTEYCRRTNLTDKANLGQLIENSNNKERLNTLLSSIEKTSKSIKPETSNKLFGDNIRMSASKFDKFSSCRFAYFCRYGLGVEKMQSAEFNVMQRGTMIHYVLERLIDEYKDHFDDLLNEDLDLITDKFINEYLDSIPGYRTVENAKLSFMVSRLSRSLKEVVSHIAEEIVQSDFKPVSCEFKIGQREAEIPNLEFPYSKGNIRISGSIDRVDKFQNYIRIVDYKSGKKTFYLSDILVGLNMQMLIYLYAVTRGNGLKDNDAAGILYQPSSRDLKSKGIPMNGLIIEDTEIANAMDKSGVGKFAPKLVYTQKGELHSYCTSYIKPEDFSLIFDHIERIMSKTGDIIASGDFEPKPIKGKNGSPCTYCEFANLCGVDESEILSAPSLKNDELFDALREGDNDGI